MQRLEVSREVRPFYGSLGVKGLRGSLGTYFDSPDEFTSKPFFLDWLVLGLNYGPADCQYLSTEICSTLK